MRPKARQCLTAGADLIARALIVSFLLTAPARAADDPDADAPLPQAKHAKLAEKALDPELKDQGWNLYAKRDWPPATFRLVDPGTVEVATDNSTALIWRSIPVPDQKKRFLSWRWQVPEPLAPSDVSVKGGDDRPLALHIWFEDVPEHTGLFTRLSNTFVETFFGIPVKGRVLTYVWGGENARGHRQENPWIGETSEMIILRPADTPAGVWFEEKVDLAADYERAFGHAPIGQKVIALAGDSEDNDGRSRALIQALTFHQ